MFGRRVLGCDGVRVSSHTGSWGPLIFVRSGACENGGSARELKFLFACSIEHP